MNLTPHWLGRKLAEYLSRDREIHIGPAFTPVTDYADVLQVGDVLLAEGSSRISSAIKFLTQSTWSHAALYIGCFPTEDGGKSEHRFIEADMVLGVRTVGIEAFESFHTRICRPFGLSKAERKQVAEFAIQRIGNQYDLRNVFDLARYFLPNPPIPARFRRSMLALGSGDPTRAICSTLIAESFQSLRYPILPIVSTHNADNPNCPGCIADTYKIRHHSLFAPKDFDVSPYFKIIKPLETEHFDYKTLVWEE